MQSFLERKAKLEKSSISRLCLEGQYLDTVTGDTHRYTNGTEKAQEEIHTVTGLQERR